MSITIWIYLYFSSFWMFHHPHLLVFFAVWTNCTGHLDVAAIRLPCLLSPPHRYVSITQLCHRTWNLSAVYYSVLIGCSLVPARLPVLLSLPGWQPDCHQLWRHHLVSVETAFSLFYLMPMRGDFPTWKWTTSPSLGPHIYDDSVYVKSDFKGRWWLSPWCC